MCQGGSENSHQSIFWSTEKKRGKFISLFPLLQRVSLVSSSGQPIVAPWVWARSEGDGMVKCDTEQGKWTWNDKRKKQGTQLSLIIKHSGRGTKATQSLLLLKIEMTGVTVWLTHPILQPSFMKMQKGSWKRKSNLCNKNTLFLKALLSKDHWLTEEAQITTQPNVSEQMIAEPAVRHH